MKPEISTKASIYNLIILDESGSMSPVTAQTISGCNETINTIKHSAREYADTQEHFISIFAFQSGCAPSRYLIKNVPALAATHITGKDYEPGGCTPLYDAIGSTLSDLKATTSDRPMAIGSVTIITDGYENSSERYNHAQVQRMISQLKEMGWNFNFIGANIDVDRTARSLNIDNAMAFTQDAEGTKEAFARYGKAQARKSKRMDILMKECCDYDARIERLKREEKGFFDETETEDQA